MDKAAFFALARSELFPNGILPKQLPLIENLLDACERAGWPIAFTAYAMATAHHETAKWTRLKEMGGDDYFRRMYDRAGSRPKVAASLGNTEAGDGVKFAGRGYVQLTGRNNYNKAGKAIGVDLLKEPDKAMDPAIAARILIWGMSTGAYTGKANRDYLAKSPPDYVGARRIINGTDQASMIAVYARSFERALTSADYGEVPAPVDPVIPPPPDIEPAPAPEPGFWSRFWSAFTKRISR